MEEFGFLKGLAKGTKRIFSCHPIKFLGGGRGLIQLKKIKINGYKKHNCRNITKRAVIILYGLFFAPEPQPIDQKKLLQEKIK